MTLRSKLNLIFGGVILSVIVGIVGLYWWAGTPPSRPKGVPPNAVFIWGLYVGVPAKPRGDWVNCWLDTSHNVNKCKVVAAWGALLYEGAFEPYEGSGPISEGQLVIDADRSSRAQEQVGVVASSEEADDAGPTSVPLIYLRTGNVLFPQKSALAARKTLDSLRERGSPFAPGARSSPSDK